MAFKLPIVNYGGKQVEMQVGDKIPAAYLDAAVSGGNTELTDASFCQTLNFIDKFTYTFKAGCDYKITSVDKNNAETYTLKVNTVTYVFDDLINQFDEIEVVVTGPVTIVLNCLKTEIATINLNVYDSNALAFTALGGAGKLFIYSTTNTDGAVSHTLAITY